MRGGPMTPHTVRCYHCGAHGIVKVGQSDTHGRTRYIDEIAHAVECRLKPAQEQPKHLGSPQAKRRVRRQEKRANALVGARETVASGAANQDGDGRLLGEWRTESKQTVRARYALTQKTWNKLCSGARRNGEEPLLHVMLQSGKPNPTRMVVVTREWFRSVSDEEMVRDDAYLNRSSFSIAMDAPTPLMVSLEPVGVLVHEAEFTALKEASDAS